MKKIYVKIFSKNVLVQIKTDNTTIINALDEQLGYYQPFNKDENVELLINIVENFNHHNVLRKNPSIHSEIENGFITESFNYKTAFYMIDEKLNCDLAIKSSGNKLMQSLRKFNNIEFASREERIAQILFEAVLIPSLFFDKEKIPVHSSGFYKNGKGILIGGTGGSGKTSLELELCLQHDFGFTNDDIAVINLESEILPNLAHPKIYGYNLKNNIRLKERLLNGKGTIDLLQWNFKSKILGPAKVRRKLYLKNNFRYTNKKIKLEKYFILMKENRDNISIENISGETASQLHVNVILAEYSNFINNIRWHEFNSTASNSKPIITFKQIQKNWEINSKKIFAQTDNYIIKIPLKIDHTTFLKTTSKLISEKI